MRILVHEFVSGGGLAGQDVPASLAREGAAMRTALVSDLAAIGGHQIVTTADPRFPSRPPPGVEVVTLPRPEAAGAARPPDRVRRRRVAGGARDESLPRAAGGEVERKGKALLGSGAAAIRRASDKAAPARSAGPRTACPPEDARPLGRASTPSWSTAAREIGYPVVVKPARGAGCGGVCLARNARELRHAVDDGPASARATGPTAAQRYVRGVAASVSLLADGRRAVALTVNAQSVRASRPFSYRGGTTPLDHPLREAAVDAASRTCQALPGLRGYVGVDLVLTESEAVVIEVNPRLTTAYLGRRARASEETSRHWRSTPVPALFPGAPPVHGAVSASRSGPARISAIVMGPILGWDVGGANVKAARIEDGARPRRRCSSARSRSGANRDGLPALLAETADGLGRAPNMAVTMTAELADCFATKREGVASCSTPSAPRSPTSSRGSTGSTDDFDPARRRGSDRTGRRGQLEGERDLRARARFRTRSSSTSAARRPT